ncbi:hypothetical protein CEXT_604801 [Caerostris extrusa]|uniref:Uncharacterized protein n=1 Tax=Caerostris extrusa TaxID=172846 RepID=A0AAV4TZL1_CAEEX|nr:hypothetical protein CEXT_604801 [Caerostris extrusa]
MPIEGPTQLPSNNVTDTNWNSRAERTSLQGMDANYDGKSSVLRDVSLPPGGLRPRDSQITRLITFTSRPKWRRLLSKRNEAIHLMELEYRNCACVSNEIKQGHNAAFHLK